MAIDPKKILINPDVCSLQDVMEQIPRIRETAVQLNDEITNITEGDNTYEGDNTFEGDTTFEGDATFEGTVDFSDATVEGLDTGNALGSSPLRFRNDSGFTVPAYGVMRITGATVITGDVYLTTARPNTDFQRLYAINDSSDVVNGATGSCFLGGAEALYAGGSPAYGESRGAGVNDFSLVATDQGFAVIGNATGGRVSVVQTPPDSILVKAYLTAIAAGGSGLAKLYSGVAGSESATGRFVTVYNRTGQQVEISRLHQATWANGYWHLMNKESIKLAIATTNWKRGIGPVSWDTVSYTTVAANPTDALGNVDSGTTLEIRLSHSSGIGAAYLPPGDPNVIVGDILPYSTTEEGYHYAVGDYMDQPIGTIRFHVVFGDHPLSSQVPKGWAIANGTDNAIANGGSGINMTGVHYRGHASVAGSSSGADTHTHTGHGTVDVQSGTGTTVLANTNNHTTVSNVPLTKTIIPIERLNNSADYGVP